MKFSENIITKKEFKKQNGLEGCRILILERWYNGENVESFQNSLQRVEKLYRFLKETKEKNILIITHGWYLRILELYFKQIKTP